MMTYWRRGCKTDLAYTICSLPFLMENFLKQNTLSVQSSMCNKCKDVKDIDLKSVKYR